MYNFENKYVDAGVLSVNYSRIIASWVNASLKHELFDDDFKDWLRSLPYNFTEEDVHDIYLMATNGKMELEGHAKRYMALNGMGKFVYQLNQE